MAKAKAKQRPRARATSKRAPRWIVPRATGFPVPTAAAKPVDNGPSSRAAAKRRSNASVQQPSTRVHRNWTPRQLKLVERSADSGSMLMLADLCDQLAADERVRKAFETVVGGLLSLDITFEASGDGRRRGRAVKALEADEDWWAAFPEAELQQFLTAGRLAGVSFAQIIWTPHKGRLVPRLEPWSLSHFRFDWQKRKWFARIDGGSEIEVNPGDGQWIAYMPYGTYRPWAYGQWRGLARWWMLKYLATGDWGRTGSVGASMVATPRETADIETSKEQRQELANDMHRLSQDGGVLVLPNGFEMKVVEAVANTARNYGQQIAVANTAIDIAVQGQNLTSEVEGGSHAAATVHERVENRIIRNVGSTAATCLHDQALTHWGAQNFGDPNIAPWPTWDTDPPADTKEEAEGQKSFGEAMKAVQDAGFEVTNSDELAEKHGLKIKKVDKPEPEAVPPAPGKKPPPEPAVPGKKPKQSGELPPAAEGSAPFVAVLASGAPVSENPGFVAGQVYVDAVVEEAAEAAAEALEPTIEAIARALEAATSYEDLRVRLKALAPKLELEQLNELVYRAMLLGEMAGRLSVSQDA